MLNKLSTLSYDYSLADNAGISPLVVVLFIVCLVIVIGAIIWGLLISKKSNTSATVITITDEDELAPTNTTVVEDIVPDTPDEENT